MRPSTTNQIRWPITAAVLIALTACGGGGGGGGGFAALPGAGTTPADPPPTSPPAPPPAPPSQPTGTLLGVAATGAAFAGAKLEVLDQRGVLVCEKTTLSDGSYACELPEDAKAPLVIRATREDQVLYSTTASVAGGTVNITPLTTIIAAQLAPNGDPSRLAAAIQADASVVSEGAIRTEVQALLAVLKPLLEALGQSDLDPMNGVLVADGTGADKVLDAVTVSVRPDGDAANIEITLKVPANAEGAILSRPFRTSDATVAPLDSPTAEQVAALSDLPTPAQISAFLGRLDACFALPLTRRVSTASSDSQDAIGTAADVVAPECRRLFVGDDPATFTANGGTVGRNAAGRGAWSALFRQGPTGMVHDRGNFEYFRVKDGVNDKVLSYRWTDRLGNTDNETLVVRTEQGELKLTGNSNLYAATVRPVSEDREYLNMPEYNAFTTGYNISIDNRIVAGRSVFDRVEVTPPWSATPIVFRPRDGLSYLVTGPTDDAVTSILRLAAGYANPATAGNLADRELRIPFASPQYDEAMMRALKDQSLWKMEFFPAGGGSSNVQTYRTLSRAQSIAEIRQLKFAQLTAAQRTELLQATATDGRITFGPPSASDPNNIDFSSEGGGDAWEVPAGAIAPTSVSVTGRVGAFGSQRFNDGSLVRNTARKTIIYCVPQSSADLHCVKQPSTSEFWQYAGGSSFNSIELWARTARQVEMKKQIALYKSF